MDRRSLRLVRSIDAPIQVAHPAIRAIRPVPIVEHHDNTALYEPPLVTPPEPTRRIERCPDCGHNIRVLFTPHCPSCGVNIVSAVRRHEHNAKAKWILLDQYRKGLVPMIIAYTILIGVLLAKGTPEDIEWFIMRQVSFLPMAIGLYWMLNLIWLGSDQPFPVSVMGIMTAVAVSDTVGFFMWGVTILFAYQLAVGMTLAVVACKTLELDPQEGLIVGGILGTLRWLTHISMALAMS